MVKDIFINGNGGWVGVVARLGLPVFLSLVLTGFLVFKVDTAIAQQQATAEETQRLMMQAQANMDHFADTQDENSRVLRNLLLQVCINTAKADADTRECVSKAR